MFVPGGVPATCFSMRMKEKTSSRYPCSARLVFVLALLAMQPAVAQSPNPLAPTGLRVTGSSDAGISLSWTAPTDDGHGAIAAYNVFRCVEGTSACEPEWYAWLDSGRGTSYTDASVTAGTTYRYAVGSMRYLGGEPGEKSEWSNQVTVTVGTPSLPQAPQPRAPTGVQATAASSGGISLTWTAPADDGHGAISAYNVFRCVEGTSACEPEWYAWLDSGSDTSYTDASVTVGTTYRYAVGSMRYLGGEPGEKSEWSNEVTATAGTPSPPQPPPTTPTDLQVLSFSATAINLSWTAPNEVSVRGYNVLRCVEDDVPCAPEWHAWVTAGAGDPPPAPTEYTDTGVTAGTTYRYAVEAKVGEDYEGSPWSNQIIAAPGTNTGRDGTNLVTNGSFENGNTGWSVWGGASVIDANASEGSFSVMVTQHNGAEQTVTGLQPNTRYTLTGSGKVTGSNAMAIGVNDHGSNEEYMEFTSSDYTTKSFSFTTGFSSRSATIYVYKYSGTEAGYGDNIVLTQETGSKFTLAWSDEFDGSGAVDPSKWRFENGFVRNEEAQWYQAANAFQENGHLVIEGRRESFENPDYVSASNDWKTNRQFVNYTSASLITMQRWQYSKIVVRAKVTNHTGTWPAIWTLGERCEWPSNGEVDIMENYGGNILANFAWGTNTRWGPIWDSSSRSVSSLGLNWTDDFHIWELNWDEDRMSIYLDGQLLNDRPLGNTTNGSAACEGRNPFKQPHYLLLNLALGGSQGGSVDNLAFPTRYLVDYVRAYSIEQEKGDQTAPPDEEPITPAPAPPSGHPVVELVPPPEDDPTAPPPETDANDVIIIDLGSPNGVDESTLDGTFVDKYQYLQKGVRNYISDPGGRAWNGTAWQGDRVHAPLLVWAKDTEWRGSLEYVMSDLTGGLHQIISKDQVTPLFPTYVTADPDRRGCGGYAARDGIEPIYLADALSAAPGPVELPDEPFKVWLTIDVPEDTGPGDYSGQFSVRDPAVESEEVLFTIKLTVADLKLPAPAEWQFELNLSQHPEWVLRHYNTSNTGALIRRWSAAHYDLLEGPYRLLADAGQKWVTTTLKDGALGTPGMVSWTRVRETGNDWRFDFSVFGAHVQTLQAWGIGPRIEAVGILGWNRGEVPYWSEQHQARRVLHAPVGSVAHTSAWQAFLPAFREYLQDKGWFEQTYLYVDEADSAALGRLVALIRADNPEWNIAVSHVAGNLPASVLDSATATNLHLGIAAEAELSNTVDDIRTFFTNCADDLRLNSFITSDSNPAEVEWLTWYAEKLDQDGFSRWAYDYWRAAEPLNMRQLSFTSGDTALAYRTSNDAELEATTSIRLELLRHGIQQFEKRRILRELYARCGYAAGSALMDQLVSDNLISIESAGNGYAKDDLVRAYQQLEIVTSDAQALAGVCS